jgi:type VI protein secretion system component VasK
MNQLKRFLGIIWMMIGPVLFLLLVWSALKNINLGGNTEISNPIPWIIIIAIFAPIAAGLVIFGWYSWKGEYNDESN